MYYPDILQEHYTSVGKPRELPLPAVFQGSQAPDRATHQAASPRKPRNRPESRRIRAQARQRENHTCVDPNKFAPGSRSLRSGTMIGVSSSVCPSIRLASTGWHRKAGHPMPSRSGERWGQMPLSTQGTPTGSRHRCSSCKGCRAIPCAASCSLKLVYFRPILSTTSRTKK